MSAIRRVSPRADKAIGSVSPVDVCRTAGTGSLDRDLTTAGTGPLIVTRMTSLASNSGLGVCAAAGLAKSIARPANHPIFMASTSVLREE